VRERILSGCTEPPGRSRESGGFGGGGGGSRRGGGGGRGSHGGNPLGGGLLLSLCRRGRGLYIGQSGAGRVLYPREESGDGGVTPIGEVGGFPLGGVGLGERYRVAIVPIGGVIMRGKVGM